MSKKPSDLSKEELAGLVEGLMAMMYGDTDSEGNSVWNPDMSVSGADLVEWAGVELSRLGLVPQAGPAE